MKKSFLIFSVTLLALASCGKKTEEKAVITSNNETNSPIVKPETPLDLTNSGEELTYPFKASDGSRAIAKFTNTEKENTILIRANNHMFQLDRKEFTKKGAKYERNGVGAEVLGDSLIITQNDMQIDLVLVK